MTRFAKFICGGLFALLGCSPSEPSSPFDLWDMKAGMPFSALDSIALHDQKERFECAASHRPFRMCRLQSLGAFGLVEAVIDSAGRAVRISYFPHVESMYSFSDMIAGLQIETRQVRARWNRSATAYPDPSYRPPARGETWQSRDGRWGAAIIWGEDGWADEFRVTEVRAVERWNQLAQKARADSLAAAAAAPVEVAPVRGDPALLVELARADLRRMVDAQIAYHDTHQGYADHILRMGFSPRPDVEVRVGAADANGWWARAHHRKLPEHSCTVWMGRPPRPPAGLGDTERQPVCTL